MTITYRRDYQRPRQVFDLGDRYARKLGIKGAYPRPLGALRLNAIARLVDGVRRDFPKGLELIVRRNPNGYLLFFDRVRLPNGEIRQRALADGTYILRVEGDFYQPVDLKIDIPMPQEPALPTAFDLLPGFAYPFPRTSTKHGNGIPTLLLGGVQDGNAEPIAGIIVRVAGQEEIGDITDSSGQWLLIFPDALFSLEQPTLSNVEVQFLSPEEVVVHTETIGKIEWGRLERSPPIELNGP